MRFVVPVQSIHAALSRRYLGLGRGITWLNAVNGQVAGIGAVVVPGTMRDSVNILDTLLNLDAGPRPEMVTTDTASYSDIVFGLFRMLGYRFSPRIADLSDQRFWRAELSNAPACDYGPLNAIARNRTPERACFRSPRTWRCTSDYTGAEARGSATLAEIDQQYEALTDAIDQGALQQHLDAAPLVDIDDGMRRLLELSEQLPDAPAYPIDTFSAVVDLLAPSLRDHPLYRQVCDGLDDAVKRQEGDAAVGDKCRIIREQAYVGGKGIDNTGGTVVHYLYHNALTRNAVLIEIKTPETALLTTAEYRNGVYGPSRELGGATQQLLHAGQTLQDNFTQLTRDRPNEFNVFSPRALLIIGHLPAEQDAVRRRSFETYRNNVRALEIITFDELLEKVRVLLQVLEQ